MCIGFKDGGHVVYFSRKIIRVKLGMKAEREFVNYFQNNFSCY